MASVRDDISLATFPRDDAVFAAFVRGCWTGLHEEVQRTPEELQRLLRRCHTKAVVRPREDVADLGAGRIWYVYRDGHAGIRSEVGWWRLPATASVRFDASGRFIEANTAAETMVARPLVGAQWTELVPPEARTGEGAWVWETLRRDGHVQSVFELPLAEGRRRVIEYYTEPTDRPGEFRSFWRELTTIDVAVDS
jgi:PAS domain-containing protein